MTTVYMNPVLAACLFKLEQRIGNDTWQSKNEDQLELVEALPNLRALVGLLPQGMLDSIGSTCADDLNKFLHERGMTGITVPPFSPEEFGAAAVLDVLTMWAKPGVRARYGIKRNGSEYPTVEMTGGFAVSVTADGFEVVRVDNTTAGVEVFMAASASLEQGLRVVRSDRKPSSEQFKGLRFPMVDFDSTVDVGWLIGLRAVVGDAAPARVSAAFAQAKLRINEFGAHAKAGAAIRVTRSAGGPRTFEINEPFTIAFMVAGQVALAFHVTPEDWKAPPNLGTKADSAKGEVW